MGFQYVQFKLLNLGIYFPPYQFSCIHNKVIVYDKIPDTKLPVTGHFSGHINEATTK